MIAGDRKVIADRYDLGREIGRGGMGAVWLGRDTVLGRDVALKRIGLMPGVVSPDLQRAGREARLAARLNHPHVVAVFDLVEDGDETWLVMEYVEGITLSAFVKRDGALTPDEAAPLVRQAADALAAAHAAGIVHRDVKPSNMLVGQSGEVKLTDFGIARAAEQTRLTQVGSVVGTAAYLAPEQARGDEATPASDVYALGVVIYQLLTGRLPWEGTTLAELAIRRENERPLAPSSYDPEVPETLSTAVLRSLEGDPGLRYTTARELAHALRDGLAGAEPLPPDSEAATRAMTGAPTTATRRMPAEEPPTPPTRRAPAPRPASRARPAPTPAPAAAKRSAGGRVRRVIGLILVIAILAAIIAAIVLVTTNAGQNTGPGELIKTQIHDQINAIKDFINSHTQ